MNIGGKNKVYQLSISIHFFYLHGSSVNNMVTAKNCLLLPLHALVIVQSNVVGNSNNTLRLSEFLPS